MSSRLSLADRFPVLKRLDPKHRRTIPYVPQTTMTDCGAASLAMVLGFYGKQVPVEDIQNRMDPGRDGTSMRVLLMVAESYGLRGRAVRLDLEDLDYLERGSILHWRMSHFVVLDRIARRSARIIDPSSGPRTIPIPDLNHSFTGAALILEPGEFFSPDSPTKAEGRRPLFGIMRSQTPALVKVLFASLAAQVAALSVPLLTGTVVDRVVPRGDSGLLLVMMTGVALLTLFAFIVAYVRSLLLMHIRANIDIAMMMRFMEHMLSLPLVFFQRRQAGDLMLRLNSNMVIRETLTSSALSAALDGGMVALYLVILFVTEWHLAFLVLALGLLRVVLFAFSRRRYRELMSLNLEAEAQSSNYQVQMIEGIETIKSSGTEGRALERWLNLHVDVMNVTLRRDRLAAVVDSLMNTLGLVSPLLFLGYGASLVLRGDLTLGTMLAMSALAGGFLVPISTLTSVALQLQTLGGYMDRVDDVLNQEPEEARVDHPPAPPLSGHIVVKGASFRYTNSGPWVLKDVSIEASPGGQIAIVGPSGSGKSTLARLLVRLYEPEAGSVCLDDMDTRHYSARSIRSQIGFVQQDPFLFSCSIRDNLTLATPQATLASVQAAAKLALIHDDIEAMPMGYETVLTAGGGSLSGGQRQRLALARALIGNPRILILDEATSHLDTLTERRVQENLRHIACTRVVIAHRLSTVVHSDRIFVMNAGRVVEAGVHSSLIRNGGLYAKMHGKQPTESVL